MRLITVADFDGLACGAILRELGVIDRWKYVHPDDVHSVLTQVTKDDVLANIPYAEGCGLWFDHHSSEAERVNRDTLYEGASYTTTSAARVIYDHYKGRQRIPHMETLVRAVDKIDSGHLNIEEVLCPTEWVMLGFVLDPLTAVGFHNSIHHYKVSMVSLIEELMDTCLEFDIDELLMFPNVAERIEAYRQQSYLFRDMIISHSRVEDGIVITDLRGADPIYIGNRFLVYVLFPQEKISIWLVDSHEKGIIDFTVGRSIINHTTTINIGKLMIAYGGNGQHQVGTCQVPIENVEKVLNELICKINVETIC